MMTEKHHTIPTAKTRKGKVYSVVTTKAIELRNGSMQIHCKLRDATSGTYFIYNKNLKCENQGYHISPQFVDTKEFTLLLVSDEPLIGRREALGFDAGEVIANARPMS